MHSQLANTEAEIESYKQHTANLRRRAARLREEAELAKEHAVAAIRSVQMRRMGQAHWREEAELRAEEARGMRELSAYIDGLRREQEMLRDETALQDRWFREQVLEMLEQGWTRAELREAGFGDAFLADLGLLDHPALPSADGPSGQA
jgi:hypothetical protein